MAAMTPQEQAIGPDGHLTGRPAAATVVFTAHNRRELVLEAVRLALAQTLAVHVIVADDASTDGTEAAVRAAFPGVTYLYSGVSRGPCYQRNRGIETSRTEVVFPLDDDSLLVSPRTLEQGLAGFADPAVGIVALPFCNALQSPQIHHDPAQAGEPFFAFVACAHGVRREAVLAAIGFAEVLFYTHEETDLALRLAERGWRTVVVPADPIEHMQQPARRHWLQDYYGRRNDLLMVWMHAPAHLLPWLMVHRFARGLRFSLRTGRMKSLLAGTRDALREIVAGRVKRAPIGRQTYADYLAAERAERKRSTTALQRP